ncbi:GNAT family N-acetyltransferase [Acidiphilium acidophilum]|uniref:GNAT family N-acetyltransferase n=1 Tax=Acidiphilium acidophilum TaxID=76588 RepID=A0AAW9DPE7_ACIAO|nr:GNAT family N-acetyltransferase [Acidiphilium acidophilum]MDX5930771.1 GNAT family N-acetyltransferase [Acidiphilium acidophilum]
MRDPDDRGRVAALSIACADYAELVTGLPPTSRDGDCFFDDLPPGRTTASMLKLGISDDRDRLIALLDVVMDYPDAGVWYVGLLLIHPEFRRQGLGRSLVNGLASHARAQGAASLRLGVVEANAPALAFWLRLGFRAIGDAPDHHIGVRVHRVIEFEYALSDRAPMLHERPRFG